MLNGEFFKVQFLVRQPVSIIPRFIVSILLDYSFDFKIIKWAIKFIE